MAMWEQAAEQVFSYAAAAERWLFLAQALNFLTSFDSVLPPLKLKKKIL